MVPFDVLFFLTITLYQTYVFLWNKNSISEILTNTIYNTTDQITSLEKRRKEIEMLQREIQHTLQLLQEPITNEKIAKVDIMFEQLEREKTLFKDYKGNK